MTLDYKILGQLYYGPEINQEPEIPGTSGYYTYTTGSIANRFVAVAYGSNAAAYSDDGITWTASTMPASPDWLSVTYGNGKFVAVAFYSNQAAYSNDGITWTATTMPSIQSWYSVTFGNGRFVAISSSNQAAYSNDGITWTAITMPSSEPWYSVTFGNGRFVAIAVNSNQAAYSDDGITWTASTMPASAFWYSVTYGNGKFVAVDNSNQAAYSTDGITWTASTMPANQSWYTVTYGNGKFVAIAVNSNQAAYSTDGITWTASTMPSSKQWSSTTFGQINTLQEIQISIGGQGTPGSYVEIIDPQSVYTVPNGTETTITSIFITNHDSVERTFDLAVVPNGEELSTKHHIRWDMPVDATDFHLINAKITMSAGDSIWVFPSTINKVGFTLFGVEKS